jgi:hypothetical protein
MMAVLGGHQGPVNASSLVGFSEENWYAAMPPKKKTVSHQVEHHIILEV